MATLKINVMSIVAIILMVSGIIALSLYEAPLKGSTKGRSQSPRENTYEAFLIIPILLALVVLIVTCADIEQLKTKTFLIYALAAVMLLIGIIIFAVVLEDNRQNIAEIEKVPKVGAAAAAALKNVFNHWVASIVFAVVALIAAIAGTVAPFVCNKNN